MYFTRIWKKSGGESRAILYLLEYLFVFSRVLVTYTAVIVLLTAMPIVQLVQKMVGASGSSGATAQAVSLVWLGKSSISNASTFFTAEEVSHLDDVHRVVMSLIFLTAVAICMSILIERHVVSQIISRLYRRISVFILVISLPLLLAFPFFFEVFHRLFFPQGNYSFAVESVLIQCFPLGFWVVNFILLQTGAAALLWWQARYADSPQI